MTSHSRNRPDGDLPDWVSPAAQRYLRHTELGQSIREVARDEGCHASTILRQVRRFEQQRDDPLVDGALARLGRSHFSAGAAPGPSDQESASMSAPLPPTDMIGDRKSLEDEARRVLRRLVEPGALMAVAPELDKAAVLRDMPDGRSLRTAVVERAVAEAFALNEWIAAAGITGRVARYRITGAGRALLKRLLAEEESAEAQPFAEQHRDWGTRDSEDPETGARRQMRYNMAESPVVALSRRRDKDGKPFLSAELVAAAERLREDFELAQMGPRVAQNWERFLTAGCSSSPNTGGTHRGPQGARDRVARALRDLGPGLGDTALRCCCYLEGLEVTEKKMGWSARSGKIVLRIALMRLARHYAEAYDDRAHMIG